MAYMLTSMIILGLLAGLISCQSENFFRQTKYITARHRKLHLRRGSTASIKCHQFSPRNNRSRSFDSARWYRNGIPLIVSGNTGSRYSEVFFQGQFVLNIHNVGELDEGTYTCNSRRGRGTILAVGDSPFFIIGPRSISPPHGEKFEVKCLAVGKPSPIVRIFQDSKDITIHSRLMYSGRAVNVSIIKATVLACQAQNVHGMIWKNATVIPQGVSNYDTDEEGESILPLVLGGVVGFFIVLTIFLIIVWLHLRRHQTITITKLSKEFILEEGNYAKFKTTATKLTISSQDCNSVDQQYIELEVSRERIEFTKEVVQGSDYIFSHGHLLSERLNAGKMQVTIKTLKNHTSSKYISKEIRFLRQLHNHNVLRLTATCTLEDPQLFVFEYCPNGDLKTFLQNRNPKLLDLNTIKRYSQLYQLPFQHLGLQEKLQIASQICKGMSYLEENNYVHKDLAARNCLVSESMAIKVSDIGLGLESYPEDYNLIKVEENSFMHLSLRWTSPESITDLEFSFKSTVWTFGVVLWEIFAYSRQPFGAMNQEQIMQSITKGRMLPRPHKCPRDVYQVIQSCWNISPEFRPTFASLEHQLGAIQNGTEV